jgi:TolB-like protein
MPEPCQATGAVFLSYASEDAAAASRICETLRSVGINVWFDQNELRGGDAWDHKIRRQVNECRLFIPIISEHTEARPEGYFRLEWDLADQRSHMIGRSKPFIVPVCIDRIAERGADVPDAFLKAQWVRLPAGEASTSFTARRAGLLRGERASQPQPTGAPQTAASAPPKSSHGRTALVLASVVAAAAFGWQAWRTFGPGSEPILSDATPPTVTRAVPTVPEKSIAVLPFLDMSPGKDQEYMSDGIAEEILNLLAQVPDFKVIARTSSFSFKNKNVPIAEIAKQLNVSNVLEGSVRKSGDTLRITAQLIRAADSTHLWSSSYDRPLTDIFAVQTEIANAIVQALQIGLMGGKLTRREGGTENLEAYQLYLRAVAEYSRNSAESLKSAGELAEKAVQLDPDFGMGWSALADVHMVSAENLYLPSFAAYEKARELAKRALQLSPNMSNPHATLAFMHLDHDWDWASAKAEVTQALARDPSNPYALHAAGRLAATLGQWDEAERHLRAAQVRDPLNPFAMFNLADTYYRAGRYAEAETAFRKLLVMQPDFAWTHAYFTKTLVVQGKNTEALETAERESIPSLQLASVSIALQAAGRKADADKSLQVLLGDWSDSAAYYIAQVYAFRRENDRALEWLERAYQQKDVGLDEIVGEHMFSGLSGDPRYKAFLRKMKLPEIAARSVP